MGVVENLGPDCGSCKKKAFRIFKFLTVISRASHGLGLRCTPIKSYIRKSCEDSAQHNSFLKELKNTIHPIVILGPSICGGHFVFAPCWAERMEHVHDFNAEDHGIGYLHRAGKSIVALKRFGEVELELGLKITFQSPSRYTLVDLGSDTGEGLADWIPEHDRHLVPAWANDSALGSRLERLSEEKARQSLVYVRHTLIFG